ncbi:ACES-like protein [Mya arenaria]|uniref:Carboxylic ester hydrolase n=1 Tax=Mya arenaria TaxID=6604 RepID=A0ABY7F3W6_MYAAR|nr:ACES-like protein [Mya arenaria]
MTKKSLLTVTCLHFTVFVLSIISVNAQYHVLVRTEHGEVEGFTVRSQYEAYDRRRVNVFLGVPYAKQPTQYQDWRREFRFNKPEKPSWTGTWKADKYGPACPQLPWFVKQTVPSFSRAATSEDCLYMNIFTPNATDEQPVANPNLFPVMVFIHGGGWTMGASQQIPEHSRSIFPGALEFVKENIRSFRGNPNMVTIFGHSTGAASVGLHLLSPRSYNLFHQAIMMSGSDRTQWAVLPSSDDASYYASELARETGCPPNDNYRLIRCLQEYRRSPWSPVVDGPFQGSQYAFMTDQPRDMRSQGRFQKLRVMGGLTKDDGSYFIPNMPSLQEGLSPTQFDNILLEFLRDQNVKDMMMSDYLFGTGMDETLRSQNLYNRTYMYLFNYKSRYDYVPTWRDSKYTVSNFGNIPWLEYNLQNHSYLEIGNKTQNRVNFRQRQYVFWREYFLSITNRGQILTTTTSKPLSENEFQIATYSVGALAAVLLIICIALTIVIWRMRPKDY